VDAEPRSRAGRFADWTAFFCGPQHGHVVGYGDHHRDDVDLLGQRADSCYSSLVKYTTTVSISKGSAAHQSAQRTELQPREANCPQGD
jgi:hypothetical protein